MSFTRINLTLGNSVNFSTYNPETNQLTTEEQVRRQGKRFRHFEAATRSKIGSNPIGWYAGYQFFSWAGKYPQDLINEGSGTLDNAFTKRVIALINDIKSNDSGQPFQVVFDGKNVNHLNRDMLEEAGLNFQINVSPIKTAVEVSLDDGISFSVQKPKTGEAFTEAQVRETLPFNRLQEATRCVFDKVAPLGWYAGYQFFDWASKNPRELTNEGTGTVDKAFTKRIIAMIQDLEDKYGSEGFQVCFAGKNVEYLNRGMLEQNGFAFETSGATVIVTKQEGSSSSSSGPIPQPLNILFPQGRRLSENDCSDERYIGKHSTLDYKLYNPKGVGACYKMLQVFHELAEKHGIYYVMSAGSVLGNTRHKGRMPWDDDEDLFFLEDERDILLSQEFKDDLDRHGLKIAEGWILKLCYKETPSYGVDLNEPGIDAFSWPFVDLFYGKFDDQGTLRHSSPRAIQLWGDKWDRITAEELGARTLREHGPLKGVYFPSNPRPYLDHVYGAEWSTKVKTGFDPFAFRHNRDPKLPFTAEINSPADYVWPGDDHPDDSGSSSSSSSSGSER